MLSIFVVSLMVKKLYLIIKANQQFYLISLYSGTGAENDERRQPYYESSNDYRAILDEELQQDQDGYSQNDGNVEYFAPDSILQPSTSKILSSSFSSSASSPFIVPTTRGRRSMFNAASQTTLGSGYRKLDPSPLVVNPSSRRGALTMSSKMLHSFCDHDSAPRVTGASRANANYGQSNRSMLIVELPAEILVKIMNYMSFNQISLVRLVGFRDYELFFLLHQRYHISLVKLSPNE